jgi:hypothetical protein
MAAAAPEAMIYWAVNGKAISIDYELIPFRIAKQPKNTFLL